MILSALIFSTAPSTKVSTVVTAASCDCPASGDCAPCSGGLTSLTLQYTGNVAAQVVVEEIHSQRYSGMLNPGDVFIFDGSLPQGKFQGPELDVKIDGAHHVFIPTSCGSSTVPHAVHGSFRIVQSESQDGPICCVPGMEEDNVLPTIANCPSDINADADASGCATSVSWNEPIAADNCTLIAFDPSHAAGSTFPIGTTTVTYTATDDSGNSTTCQFNVTVNDVSAPVISQCPENITVTANESGTIPVTWTTPTFSDNCAGTVLTTSHEPGDVFTTGVTEVTYTAQDLSGNSSVCTFTVTVQAATPPEEPDPDTSEPDPSEPGVTDPGTDPNPVEPGETGPGTNAPEEQLVLEISKIITPDGNGINDTWLLTNITRYSTNEVLIVDRWGNEIFHATGYDNESVVWSGRNAEGKILPSGTYFYLIRVQAESSTMERKGFVELVN